MPAEYRDETPLTRRFPGLAGALPWLALGDLPTPVEPFALNTGAARPRSVTIKRDDLSGPLYGGNKVRKLELLLAAALARGATSVMTFGTAGSNHVLATSLYARELGLDTVAIMTHQRNAKVVGRNLLGDLSAHAALHVFADAGAADAGARSVADAIERRTGRRPYAIRGGGSSPLGTVGFVNAALELAEQVEAGQIGAPDTLYVALGTMGTAAGLILGLAAAGLSTRVVPVRVVHPTIGHESGLKRLIAQTARLLNDKDPAFPAPSSPVVRAAQDTAIRHEFFGEKYGVYTADGQHAVRAAGEADVHLEGTYTGKTLAALRADLDAGRLENRDVVFWNTYNSRSLDARIADLDYRDLPQPFHRYFETPPQDLDG